MQTLAEYLKSTKTKQRVFAERLDISQNFLSEIINGKKTPSLHVALRIYHASKRKISLESLVAE